MSEKIRRLEQELEDCRIVLKVTTDQNAYRAVRREMNEKHSQLEAYRKIERWGVNPDDPAAVRKLFELGQEMEDYKDQLDAAWMEYTKAHPGKSTSEMGRYFAWRNVFIQKDVAIFDDARYVQDILGGTSV
jgi:hypothetical protein